jgi:hypothetical protein
VDHVPRQRLAGDPMRGLPEFWNWLMDHTVYDGAGW